jgi:UDP-2,3-diacylglucosamine hydrolase
MSARPAYVASDAHLGAAPPAMEAAFHRWLESAAEHAGIIVINGDLFDFWFEWGSVIPRGHTRILGLLARVVDSGVPVHLVGGNHDWWGGRYLTHEVGVSFHSDESRMNLGGRTALVAHGDGLGQGDIGYRILKGVLRSPVSRMAFRWLHPDVGSWIARGVSRTHAEHGGPGDGHEERSRQLERWARDRIVDEGDLDLVLLGHTHIPRLVEMASNRFYVNTGDWIRNGTYAVLEEGRPPRLERWKDLPR